MLIRLDMKNSKGILTRVMHLQPQVRGVVMSLSIRITVAVLILAAATAVPQVAHQFSY